jgi:membrane protein required for beta-lactamase induction
VRAIFLASHQRIFGVVFWFVILGPIGAVFYRLIEGISSQMLTGSTLARQIKGLLDWLPVRLEVLLFALGGHFTAVLIHLKRDALKGPGHNDQFLADCGMAAMDAERLSGSVNIEQEALGLIDRAFMIGLVIFAIAVLLG